jgi:hypothetical protein
MPSPWLAICLLLGAGGLARGEDFGSIQARVLDSNGTPVKGAQVDIDQEWSAASWPVCWTDEHGICSINHLGTGEFEVYVLDYKEGYPRPNEFYFGRQFKQTTVKLDERNPSASVTLRLGPKLGFLKLIVTDAITGKEILPVSFRFCWSSDPGNTMLSGRGDDLTLLVPPDVPVTMTASSEGYEDWAYTSRDNPEDHNLLLHSGERLTLNIRLHPKR